MADKCPHDRFLKGRGAVVTGGGRGIGAEIARWLGRAGASVLVAARSRDGVERVVAELRDLGGDAWGAECDISDAGSVQALTEEATERLGKVDVLVNNAGVSGSAPLKRATLEDWNRMLAVNATGTFLCARAFLPGMMERGWGRVINIASVAGLHGARYISAYTASKHAVVGFTRSVAAEVAAAGGGVTINAVCPGYVDTDMTRETVERISSATGMAEERAMESILDMTPQRRLIEPEEIASAVLYLCRHEARGINGQSLVIDGGSLLA